MFRFLTIIVLWLAGYSSQGLSEGRVGNGGDSNSPYESSSWFPRKDQPDNNTRSVHYCIDKSKDFAVQDEVRIRKAIETAYTEWMEYYRLTFNTDSLPEKYRDKIVFSEECGESIEVKFILGIETSDVLKEKSRYYNPAAFTKILERDKKSAWARGFIWLEAGNEYNFVSNSSGEAQNLNWATESVLELIIKHEIGHILGVPHVDGTIMAGNFLGLARQLTEISEGTEPAERKAKLVKRRLNIDQQRSLLEKPEIDIIYAKWMRDHIESYDHQKAEPMKLILDGANYIISGHHNGGEVRLNVRSSGSIFNIETKLENVFNECVPNPEGKWPLCLFATRRAYEKNVAISSYNHLARYTIRYNMDVRKEYYFQMYAQSPYRSLRVTNFAVNAEGPWRDMALCKGKGCNFKFPFLPIPWDRF